MTKFTSYYNLCHLNSAEDFLGVSPAKEIGDIIVTVSRNTVIVIKIESQKQLRSWSFVEKLSAKVIFDQRSSKYVGLFGDKLLRCWDPSVSDVNRVKKIKFYKSIIALICNVGDTLVLYYDGSYELLEAAIDSRKANLLKEPDVTPFDFGKSTFEHVELKTLSDGRQYIVYFEKYSGSGELDLIHIPLGQNGSNRKRFKIKRDNIDVIPVGYSITEGENCLILVTIWSDKRVFMLNLHDDVHPDKSPGNFVSMISVLRTDSPLSLTSVEKHFVAIYGANSGQDGASLLLYNTQFKVVKAKQFFKVYFDVSRLYVSNENIFLTMGQNLSVVAYHMSKEVLADLLGSQNGNELERKIETDYISEEEYLQMCLNHMDVKPKNKDDKNLFNTCSKRKGFETHLDVSAEQDFIKQLVCAKQLHTVVDILRVKQPAECIISHRAKNINVTKYVQSLFRQLESYGTSENEISEKIVTVLANSDFQQIAPCLLRYSNISDHAFVRIINKFFDMREPSVQSCSLMIDFILSHKFVFDLTPHIHQFTNYSNVLIKLDYLYKMLVEDNNLSESKQIASHFEFEMQIIRFFNIFINAHFQQLSLSRDKQLIGLLSKWCQFISAVHKFQNKELSKLVTVLKNLVQNRKVFKVRNSLKWYYIEEHTLF